MSKYLCTSTSQCIARDGDHEIWRHGMMYNGCRFGGACANKVLHDAVQLADPDRPANEKLTCSICQMELDRKAVCDSCWQMGPPKDDRPALPEGYEWVPETETKIGKGWKYHYKQPDMAKRLPGWYDYICDVGTQRQSVTPVWRCRPITPALPTPPPGYKLVTDNAKQKRVPGLLIRDGDIWRDAYVDSSPLAIREIYAIPDTTCECTNLSKLHDGDYVCEQCSAVHTVERHPPTTGEPPKPERPHWYDRTLAVLKILLDECNICALKDTIETYISNPRFTLVFDSEPVRPNSEQTHIEHAVSVLYHRDDEAEFDAWRECEMCETCKDSDSLCFMCGPKLYKAWLAARGNLPPRIEQ